MLQKTHLRRNLFICGFLLVPLGLYVLFSIWPLIRLVQFSFTSWNGVDTSQPYIGLANYEEIFFRTPQVWAALKNNLIYFLVECVGLGLSMLLATILVSKIRGSKFFRTVLFAPYAINVTAIALMFVAIYHSQTGALNSLLKAVGLEVLTQKWISDPNIVNYSLAFVVLWKAFGYYMVLDIAAIMSVPTDLYEAAAIDGANAWQKFRSITFPSIKSIVSLEFFLIFAGSWQRYLEPYIMTGEGGPGNSSVTFALYSLRTAFRFKRYGFACAMAVIMIVVILLARLLPALGVRILKKRED